ncbi:MAG: alpha/beta hydrolase [Candidatus Kryptonium sp.]
MKIEIRDLILHNASGDRITANVHFVNDFLPAPVVIYSHGFLGFKDWGFIPYVANKFAENGFVFVRFNFSHNGVSENPNKITDFNKLARNTISKQIEDLTAVIEYVFSNEFKMLTNGRLFLLGHSAGGGISVIKAVEDERVEALALWASISTFQRYSRHQIEELQKNGYIFLRVPDSMIQIKIEKIVYDDFVENQERYDILRAISKLKVPILIVHGTADVIVPLIESEKLKNANPEHAKLVLISEANHFFNIKHPLDQPSYQLVKVIEETVLFFKKINF